MVDEVPGKQKATALARWYGIALMGALLVPVLSAYLHHELGNVRNFHILITLLALAWAWRHRIRLDDLLTVPIERRHWFLMAALLGLSFLATTVTHLYGFRLNGEDFSIFDWMLYNTNHRDFMTTPICNMATPLGVCHHFGVHPNYLLIPLAWLHRLWESPLLLQLLHALTCWAGVWPLYRLCQHYRLAPVLTFLVLMAYSLNAFMGSLLNHGFHPEVFYLPVGLWFILSWVKNNGRGIAVAAALFLAIKEDAAFYLAAFGAANWFIDREKRRVCAALIAASIIVFVVNQKIVQPYYLELTGVTQPRYMTFWGHYGNSLKEVLIFALTHPFQVAGDILTSKWYFFFGLLLFIPFFSSRPLVVLLVIAAMFGMSQNGHLRGYATYYPSPLIPFTFWGLLEGYERLTQWRWSSRGATAALVMACLFFALAGGGYQKFPPIKWQALEDMGRVRAELVNHNGWVCAQTILYPHLPYHWRMQPLSEECLRQEGAIGIMNPDPFYDPYPFTSDFLKGWRERANVITTYPSGQTIIRHHQLQ